MSEKQIVVSGISSEDEIILFFESSRYCKFPGTVEHVEFQNDGTALVTFEESDVVQNLLKQKIFHLRGIEIHCTPKPYAPPIISADKSIACDAPETNSYAHDSDLSSDDSKWWKMNAKSTDKSPQSCSLMANDLDSSCDEKDATREDTSLDISDTSSTYSSCLSNVEEDLFLPAPVAHQSPKLPTATTTHEDKFNSSVEKLKLLKNLVKSQNIAFKCKVEIDCENQEVRLSGTSEEILETKSYIFETLAGTCTCTLNLSQGIVEVLALSKVDQWIVGQLAKRHLQAVFFFDKATPKVIAADEEMLSSARKWLLEAFVSEVKQIESHHASFLQSDAWHDAINESGSSGLLQITVDRKKMEVLIAGYKDAVATASMEIDELLKRNCKVCRDIQPKHAEFYALSHRSEEIKKDVKELCQNQLSGRKVKVKFHTDTGVITLTGSHEDVVTVEDHIKSKYISSLHHDTLEAELPGLSVAHFKDPDNEYSHELEVLEHKFKCGIEVNSKSQSRLSSPAKLAAANSQVKLPLKSSFEQPAVAKPAILRTSIKVVQGSLPDFKNADVLVNVFASNTSDLSKAGAIAKEFLKVGGPELQQQLLQNWPQKFGKGVVSTPVYGQIQAKKIYHVAVRKNKYRNSVLLLEDTITSCLQMAEQDQMTSIAFPTIGCGSLEYDAATIARCFVHAEHRCQGKLTIYIVAFDGKTQQKFETSIQSVPDKSNVVKSTDVIPSAAAAATVSDVSQALPPPFVIQQGSLPKFKADVLVNTITCYSQDLRKSGILSSTFLTVGGEQLQTYFTAQPLPHAFGKDVVTTNACGQIQSKLIYHAAIRKYRNSQSVKMLYDLICKCLSMAVSDQMTTIAFPTVGCGQLGYDPAVVVDCIVRAKRDTGTTLQVYVVAFEDDMRKRFADALAEFLETEKAPVTVDKSIQEQLSSKWQLPTDTAQSAVLVFHITAKDQTTVATVKDTLSKKLDKIVDTENIEDDIVAELDLQCEMEINGCQSDGVCIEIDKQHKAVKLKGNKQSFHEAKKKIHNVLRMQHVCVNSPEYIKKNKGVKEYLLHVGSNTTFKFPEYWTSDDGKPDSGVVGENIQVEMDPASAMYKEVEKLVTGTWEASKVGHGNDAQGIIHSKIVVRKIWIIKNPSLYRLYDAKLRTLCMEAAVNHIPSVNGLKGERDVITHKLGLRRLNGNLISEINEYYLLHGTKKNLVETIIHDGLDFRLAGDGMFGKGAYMAESSTKADQYADSSASRIGTNQALHMFVVRALLGNAFVCQDPAKARSWRRPPCTTDGCCKDNCSDPTHDKKCFDSVIGTHKVAYTTRLIFREFIVYDKCQCYPEFLIEYERQ